MLGMNSLIMFCYFFANVNADNSSIGFVRFLKVYDFGQNTCGKNDRAFELFNATAVSCSSICDSDVYCESFFYFPNSLRCDGCKQTYSADGQLQNVDEQSVYYTLKAQSGYRYIGCFAPPCDVGGACIATKSDTITEVNVSSCFHFCDTLPYSHSVPISTVSIKIDLCYCNLRYNTELTGNCDKPCRDNNEEMCGGYKLASVYSRE